MRFAVQRHTIRACLRVGQVHQVARNAAPEKPQEAQELILYAYGPWYAVKRSHGSPYVLSGVSEMPRYGHVLIRGKVSEGPARDGPALSPGRADHMESISSMRRIEGG